MSEKLIHVKALLDRALELRLAGAFWLSNKPLRVIADNYNGIGPEWFPPKVRALIDCLAGYFEPVALIHDNRWMSSDGSYKQFLESNLELRINGEAIAVQTFGWYNPLRYWRIHQARVFARLCQTFGWSAYRDAYYKSKNKPKA